MTTTAHMDTRVTVDKVRVGDLLVSIGKRRYDSTVVEVKSLPAGSIVYGPRGGRYRTRYAETVIVTRSGARPVVYSTTSVVVYRPTTEGE